jgi:hypothetical protein
VHQSSFFASMERMSRIFVSEEGHMLQDFSLYEGKSPACRPCRYIVAIASSGAIHLTSLGVLYFMPAEVGRAGVHMLSFRLSEGLVA